MIRELTPADAAETLALLRARPLRNLFLDYVVSTGGLARASGLLGYVADGRIGGVLMIGPLGGTTLEVRDPEAYAPLAEAASRQPVRPRHLIGSEDVTELFWREYSKYAGSVLWERREPVYLLDAEGLRGSTRAEENTCLERAREGDADVIVSHSALQHREDLKDDRQAMDPEGFAERHRTDVSNGRWWVLRERGRIAFQVHVGVRTPHATQIGGVFTPPDLRNAGHATRGVAAISARLLKERPHVSLFCAEDNTPARRVYERVGYRVACYNRSWLFDEPLIQESPAEYA